MTCNGSPLNKKDKLKAGQTILLTLPDPQPIEAQPQNIPLDIVYEDDSLLVVNKPKGMVVHPAPGNPDGTMVNALLWHCAGRLSGIGGAIRPGIVHRIDKDTSGLLVVAKTDAAHQALTEQMSVHSIHRVYHAVVYGNLKEDTGFVEAPIGRDPKDRKKMAVTQQNSKYAYTGWQVLERFGNFTYIACKLKTGRTHQNSGAYGVHWPPAGWGCRVWAKKLYPQPERSVPARQGAWLCAPRHRGMDAV